MSQLDDNSQQDVENYMENVDKTTLDLGKVKIVKITFEELP